jgi:hypothetical protein
MSNLTVIVDGKSIVVPGDFSKLLTTLAAENELELDGEAIKIEHHPEIFIYRRNEMINSMEHLLEIINSAIFYQVPENYVTHLRERFWNDLSDYSGPKLVLSLFVSEFLDFQSHIDNALKCHQKIQSCARVTLKMAHLRSMRVSPNELPFEVTGLNFEDFDYEYDDEHAIQHIVNSFAETLESLKLRSGITLDEVKKLPRLTSLDLSESYMKLNLAFCEETLEELEVNDKYTDEMICRATKLKKLNACFCPLITTVAPFTELQILYAGGSSGINDDGLSHATGLVELHIDCNNKITTVKPFATTLRKLSISSYWHNEEIYGLGINDDGLVDAKYIVELYASNNPNITTVKPFAATLQILDASCDCGIDDAGLIDAKNIIKLNANLNPKITTVEPFCATLRELDADDIDINDVYTDCDYYDFRYRSDSDSDSNSDYADDNDSDSDNNAGNNRANDSDNDAGNNRANDSDSDSDNDAGNNRANDSDSDISGENQRYFCGIGDDGLANATSIVRLCARSNSKITTVQPFASTLRELIAPDTCGIDDKGLANARNITSLDATNNSKITNIKPFASKLRYLNASLGCGITDAGLVGTNTTLTIISDRNYKITNLKQNEFA